MSKPTEFDIGPLTWVKGEIDQALERALTALRAHASNPSDADQARFSQTHFHQAHGALQIVGLDGVTRVSDEIEGLLGDVVKTGEPPAPEALAAVEHAFAGIGAYLDQLLAGEPNQPLRLYAAYKDLVTARGKPAPDPIDLYYPDLTQRPPRREKPPVSLTADVALAYFRDQRGRYQRGLLKWLKKDPTGIEDMRSAIAAVEAAQAVPSQRVFWWIALGFFDALAGKAVQDQAAVARLCNRIEQQLKRLVEGSPSVAERLMREVLFAVARVRPVTAHLREVQDTFGLAGSVPGAFDLRTESATQHPALRALRDTVANAKTTWNKVASGHQPSVAGFRDLSAQIRDRAAELGHPGLTTLANEIAAAGAWLGDGLDKVNDAVAMEIATALLVVENAVENHASLGAEFAEQVGLMHARLQACMQGRPIQAGAPVPHLDEMSRRAQERLLMTQVVAEIQASLRTIEQVLDAFFRDASKRGELTGLEKPVRQVLGALTILNEDRAAAALSTCAGEIQRFAAADYVPSHEDFERVAGTLSGLGFYVDGLQHGKADFDAFMKPVAPRKAAEQEEIHAEVAPAPSVEMQVAGRMRDLQSQFEAWRKQPDDVLLKQELERNLAAIQKDALLIADPSLEAKAKEMIALLAAADAQPVDVTVTQAIATIGAVTPEPSPETTMLLDASAETVDAELLSVYLEEAGEVLHTIEEHLEQARRQPQSIETLRTIRRGFHTLKGSGRMVGLARLGEAAWAVEQVMNRWLEDERSGTPDLFHLIEMARGFFADAVDTLKSGGSSPDEAPIVALAEKVKAGEPVAGEPTPAPASSEPSMPTDAAGSTPAATTEESAATAVEMPAPAIAEASAPAFAEPPAPAAAEASAPTEEFPSIDLPATLTESADEALPETGAPVLEPVGTITTAPESAAALDFSAATEAKPAAEEPVLIGDVQLSPALFGFFVEESRGHLNAMHAAAANIGSEGVVSDDFRRAAHTLAGIAGTVKLEPIRELSHALEHALDFAPNGRLDAELRRSVNAALAALDGMVVAAAAKRVPEPALELVRHLRPPVEAELPSLDFSQPIPVAPTLSVPETADAPVSLEGPALEPSSRAAGEPPAADKPAPVAELDFASLSLTEPASPPPAPAAIEQAPPSNVVAFPVVPQEEHSEAQQLQVEEIPVERRTQRLDDDLDHDLLPIFLEEAQELVPAVGAAMRDWQANADNAAAGNALQRVLHTLKGSARMCGAMALGELTHAMETRVENALASKTLPPGFFQDLETSYDRMGMLYDRLQNPVAPTPASAPVGEPHVTAAVPASADVQPIAVPSPAQAAAPAAKPAPGQGEGEGAQQTRAVLRVRADLIDRLVNEAGEVSIARSRIEAEMRILKGAVHDLTENVGRLRSQLREIEIQAETQMQSRIALSHEKETAFDPLEFDRFTRFQELTRMMAESVNDVGTVHQNLIKALDGGDAALLAQSRITRDLQDSLMRIRMVPFASVAERLYRVVRQATKELGKRAVLDIRGGQVELDRSVLERITAPFEHMLRNSVAHGVETTAERLSAGKSEVGEIKVEARQEGNEIVLAVADDGAGINLGRVREKAIALGLAQPDEQLSDADIAEFIFHPGFSTATEVTQLAGRGVGMDVVKSEVAALGGRVETHTEAGKGTRFIIYLPLTLAVTQALLVRAGGVTYAIPATMVDQVRQLRSNELAAATQAGQASWQGRPSPFTYLPRLLGDAESVPQERRTTPVIFARSGTQTIATQVDEMIGNQEIVVKNPGPLLSRIAGISGATVLASGEIVLIINPVILGHRETALPYSAAVRVAPGAAIAPELEAPAAPTVMIVDDSLTVRKITGRLLAREGYNVLTAKDGVDAVEQLQEQIPDVMLVDIEMPRMDGFDLTRNVRNDKRLKHVPIIMITSRTAEKHRNYAKQIGVNVFLGKPYQEEELLQYIAGLLKKPVLA